MKHTPHHMPRRLASAMGLAAIMISGIIHAAEKKPAVSNVVSRDPYIGAIVVDAETGNVVFEDHADAPGHPASMLKLMNLLIILEKIQAGAIKPDDRVLVTAEAAKIGGSQVWLAENETFSIEDLLYALMVQSANDAAVALAIHLAGSKSAFVELMNERTAAIGMTHTRFESPHGLPPGSGQKPDVTTARDFALLCRELLKHPEALIYTSTKERAFRDDPKTQVIMRTHNSLMNTFPGCDGLKTGYYRVAGYSIAATAKRGDKRVIAIVLGSSSKSVRDAKAAELLAKGFLAVSGSAAPGQ